MTTARRLLIVLLGLSFLTPVQAKERSFWDKISGEEKTEEDGLKAITKKMDKLEKTLVSFSKSEKEKIAGVKKGIAGIFSKEVMFATPETAFTAMRQNTKRQKDYIARLLSSLNRQAYEELGGSITIRPNIPPYDAEKQLLKKTIRTYFTQHFKGAARHSALDDLFTEIILSDQIKALPPHVLVRRHKEIDKLMSLERILLVLRNLYRVKEGRGAFSIGTSTKLSDVSEVFAEQVRDVPDLARNPIFKEKLTKFKELVAMINKTLTQLKSFLFKEMKIPESSFEDYKSTTELLKKEQKIRKEMRKAKGHKGSKKETFEQAKALTEFYQDNQISPITHPLTFFDGKIVHHGPEDYNPHDGYTGQEQNEGIPNRHYLLDQMLDGNFNPAPTQAHQEALRNADYYYLGTTIKITDLTPSKKGKKPKTNPLLALINTLKGSDDTLASVMKSAKELYLSSDDVPKTSYWHFLEQRKRSIQNTLLASGVNEVARRVDCLVALQRLDGTYYWNPADTDERNQRRPDHVMVDSGYSRPGEPGEPDEPQNWLFEVREGPYDEGPPHNVIDLIAHLRSDFISDYVDVINLQGYHAVMPEYIRLHSAVTGLTGYINRSIYDEHDAAAQLSLALPIAPGREVPAHQFMSARHNDNDYRLARKDIKKKVHAAWRTQEREANAEWVKDKKEALRDVSDERIDLMEKFGTSRRERKARHDYILKHGTLAERLAERRSYAGGKTSEWAQRRFSSADDEYYDTRTAHHDGKSKSRYNKGRIYGPAAARRDYRHNEKMRESDQLYHYTGGEFGTDPEAKQEHIDSYVAELQNLMHTRNRVGKITQRATRDEAKVRAAEYYIRSNVQTFRDIATGVVQEALDRVLAVLKEAKLADFEDRSGNSTSFRNQLMSLGLSLRLADMKKNRFEEIQRGTNDRGQRIYNEQDLQKFVRSTLKDAFDESMRLTEDELDPLLRLPREQREEAVRTARREKVERLLGDTNILQAERTQLRDLLLPDADGRTFIERNMTTEASATLLISELFSAINLTKTLLSMTAGTPHPNRRRSEFDAVFDDDETKTRVIAVYSRNLTRVQAQLDAIQADVQHLRANPQDLSRLVTAADGRTLDPQRFLTVFRTAFTELKKTASGHTGATKNPVFRGAKKDAEYNPWNIGTTAHQVDEELELLIDANDIRDFARWEPFIRTVWSKFVMYIKSITTPIVRDAKKKAKDAGRTLEDEDIRYLADLQLYIRETTLRSGVIPAGRAKAASDSWPHDQGAISSLSPVERFGHLLNVLAAFLDEHLPSSSPFHTGDNKAHATALRTTVDADDYKRFADRLQALDGRLPYASDLPTTQQLVVDSLRSIQQRIRERYHAIVAPLDHEAQRVQRGKEESSLREYLGTHESTVDFHSYNPKRMHIDEENDSFNGMVDKFRADTMFIMQALIQTLKKRITTYLPDRDEGLVFLRSISETGLKPLSETTDYREVLEHAAYIITNCFNIIDENNPVYGQKEARLKSFRDEFDVRPPITPPPLQKIQRTYHDIVDTLLAVITRDERTTPFIPFPHEDAEVGGIKNGATEEGAWEIFRTVIREKVTVLNAAPAMIRRLEALLDRTEKLTRENCSNLTKLTMDCIASIIEANYLRGPEPDTGAADHAIQEFIAQFNEHREPLLTALETGPAFRYERVNLMQEMAELIIAATDQVGERIQGNSDAIARIAAARRIGHGWRGKVRRKAQLAYQEDHKKVTTALASVRHAVQLMMSFPSASHEDLVPILELIQAIQLQLPLEDAAPVRAAHEELWTLFLRSSHATGTKPFLALSIGTIAATIRQINTELNSDSDITDHTLAIGSAIDRWDTTVPTSEQAEAVFSLAGRIQTLAQDFKGRYNDRQTTTGIPGLVGPGSMGEQLHKRTLDLFPFFSAEALAAIKVIAERSAKNLGQQLSYMQTILERKQSHPKFALKYSDFSQEMDGLLRELNEEVDGTLKEVNKAIRHMQTYPAYDRVPTVSDSLTLRSHMNQFLDSLSYAATRIAHSIPQEIAVLAHTFARLAAPYIKSRRHTKILVLLESKPIMSALRTISFLNMNYTEGMDPVINFTDLEDIDEEDEKTRDQLNTAIERLRNHIAAHPPATTPIPDLEPETGSFHDLNIEISRLHRLMEHVTKRRIPQTGGTAERLERLRDAASEARLTGISEKIAAIMQHLEHGVTAAAIEGLQDTNTDLQRIGVQNLQLKRSGRQARNVFDRWDRLTKRRRVPHDDEEVAHGSVPGSGSSRPYRRKGPAWNSPAGAHSSGSTFHHPRSKRPFRPSFGSSDQGSFQEVYRLVNDAVPGEPIGTQTSFQAAIDTLRSFDSMKYSRAITALQMAESRRRDGTNYSTSLQAAVSLLKRLVLPTPSRRPAPPPPPPSPHAPLRDHDRLTQDLAAMVGQIANRVGLQDPVTGQTLQIAFVALSKTITQALPILAAIKRKEGVLKTDLIDRAITALLGSNQGAALDKVNEAIISLQKWLDENRSDSDTPSRRAPPHPPRHGSTPPATITTAELQSRAQEAYGLTSRVVGGTLPPLPQADEVDWKVHARAAQGALSDYIALATTSLPLLVAAKAHLEKALRSPNNQVSYYYLSQAIIALESYLRSLGEPPSDDEYDGSPSGPGGGPPSSHGPLRPSGNSNNPFARSSSAPYPSSQPSGGTNGTNFSSGGTTDQLSDKAATRIQSAWRGKIGRRSAAELRHKRDDARKSQLAGTFHRTSTMRQGLNRLRGAADRSRNRRAAAHRLRDVDNTIRKQQAFSHMSGVTRTERTASAGTIPLLGRGAPGYHAKNLLIHIRNLYATVMEENSFTRFPDPTKAFGQLEGKDFVSTANTIFTDTHFKNTTQAISPNARSQYNAVNAAIVAAIRASKKKRNTAIEDAISKVSKLAEIVIQWKHALSAPSTSTALAPYSPSGTDIGGADEHHLVNQGTEDPEGTLALSDGTLVPDQFGPLITAMQTEGVPPTPTNLAWQVIGGLTGFIRTLVNFGSTGFEGLIPDVEALERKATAMSESGAPLAITDGSKSTALTFHASVVSRIQALLRNLIEAFNAMKQKEQERFIALVAQQPQLTRAGIAASTSLLPAEGTPLALPPPLLAAFDPHQRNLIENQPSRSTALVPTPRPASPPQLRLSRATNTFAPGALTSSNQAHIRVPDHKTENHRQVLALQDDPTRHVSGSISPQIKELSQPEAAVIDSTIRHQLKNTSDQQLVRQLIDAVKEALPYAMGHSQHDYVSQVRKLIEGKDDDTLRGPALPHLDLYLKAGYLALRQFIDVISPHQAIDVISPHQATVSYQYTQLQSLHTQFNAAVEEVGTHLEEPGHPSFEHGRNLLRQATTIVRETWRHLLPSLHPSPPDTSSDSGSDGGPQDPTVTHSRGAPTTSAPRRGRSRSRGRGDSHQSSSANSPGANSWNFGPETSMNPLAAAPRSRSLSPARMVGGRRVSAQRRGRRSASPRARRALSPAVHQTGLPRPPAIDTTGDSSRYQEARAIVDATFAALQDAIADKYPRDFGIIASVVNSLREQGGTSEENEAAVMLQLTSRMKGNNFIFNEKGYTTLSKAHSNALKAQDYLKQEAELRLPSDSTSLLDYFKAASSALQEALQGIQDPAARDAHLLCNELYNSCIPYLRKRTKSGISYTIVFNQYTERLSRAETNAEKLNISTTFAKQLYEKLKEAFSLGKKTTIEDEFSVAINPSKSNRTRLDALSEAIHYIQEQLFPPGK